MTTMSQFISRQALVVQRMAAQIMTGVSIVGLLLSVLGLYGVIAYSVSLRTHEIGIRIAVGATRNDVLRLILAQGLRLSILGIAAGTLISVLLRSSLSTYFALTNSAAKPH